VAGWQGVFEELQKHDRVSDWEMLPPLNTGHRQVVFAIKRRASNAEFLFCKLFIFTLPPCHPVWFKELGSS
jgi:hypothetical protein